MNRLGKTLALLGIWLACFFGAALAWLRMGVCALTNPGKALDIAVAIDRAANAAINGKATETISSRANRARSEGRVWGCILCRLLDRLQPDHCRKAAEP